MHIDYVSKWWNTEWSKRMSETERFLFVWIFVHKTKISNELPLFFRMVFLLALNVVTTSRCSFIFHCAWAFLLFLFLIVLEAFPRNSMPLTHYTWDRMSDEVKNRLFVCELIDLFLTTSLLSAVAAAAAATSTSTAMGINNAIAWQSERRKDKQIMAKCIK